MKSIKNKLLAGIILINSIILVGICIFKFNFEDFYITNISYELNDFGKNIEKILDKGNEEELTDYISKNGESKNISIDIYDNNDFLVYTNKGNIVNFHKENNSDNKNKMNAYKKNKCHITESIVINDELSSYIMVDKVQQVEFLSTITKLDNNYSIISKTPISAIRNTVDVAFKFLLIIFIPIIIVSIFMAIYIANKFTKPIIKLTNISNNIANLNFDEKASIYTKDEIEVLATSINKLSHKIKISMDDLKSKNEELEVMIDNKNKQERLRREFVSSVSHELKTPITVINGYAYGLKSNIVESEEDKNYYIDVICVESEKMGAMVNDLLDLYKLESKTLTLKKDKVCLRDLVKDVVKKHEFILKEQEISISIITDEILDINYYVLGDRIKLEQVLNNLLDNAISHTLNEKQININIKVLQENIYVGVFNTGKKIREEDTNKIWNSFVKLEKNNKLNYKNKVGLGLAIVREIISLHNGEYGVFNKGDGVEFWFKLKKNIL